MLAFLALDGPSDRARAARFLYPHLPSTEARNQLRTRLFRLKRRAGRDVVTSDGTLTPLDDIGIDVHGVDEALGVDAGNLPGDLLGDLDYPDVDTIDAWLVTARSAWARRRNDRLASIASDLECRGEIVAALRCAERLIAEAPGMEHAHRRLMRLHDLRGDRAAAL